MLDLDLPKVDGLAVLDELRSAAQRTIPVIVLSSSAASHDVEQAYQRGANAYIVKPYDHAEFEMVLGTTARFWCRAAVLPVAGVLS